MAPITDIRAYSTLGTDNLPRILVRDSSNRIFIDSGQVGTLSGNSQGACMIPYRPNQSPQAWMYVAGAEDYKKYSAPDIITQGVTEFEVGIEEQQQPPEACPNLFQFTDYFALAASWTNGGTAGAPANTVRLTDTAIDVLVDPASQPFPSVNIRSSIQVSSLTGYQIGMPLDFAGGFTEVADIYPAVNDGTAIIIDSIYYFSGTTGKCVVVPRQSPVPSAFQTTGQPPSLYTDNPLSALRRGSIVNLNNGGSNENLFVLSVAIGPDGTICFEVDTSFTFAAGDNITGIPAICCSGVTLLNIGDPITVRDISYQQVGAGIGTMSNSFGASRPFNTLSLDGTATTQQYDYLQFGINISDLERLVAVTFIFNINPSVTYDTDAFYLQVTASDLLVHAPRASQTDALFTQFQADLDARKGINGLLLLGGMTFEQYYNQRYAELAVAVNALSILPASQYTTLLIPITSLKRLGSNVGYTLTDANGIRVQIETSGSMNVRMGPFYIGIGDQPDVGKIGAPYRYAVRTRSPLTGAKSNPSPVTRYGVGPRRQSVRISMQDTNSDIQDSIWDVFRDGGAVNSFRYIGSTPNTGGVDIFEDNYFDTAAAGGSLIEYDNFQPWPTIDVPYMVTAGGGSGVTITINVIGTVVLVVYSSGSPFTSPAPSTILRWLPGTIMTLDNLNAYTLWNRPTLVTLASPPAANYFAYMFRIVENAGTATPQTLNINEPLVANQDLPYLWGPDAEGTVFGCGDPFRPGNVYFCKKFDPDSAPDNYNQEITNPSEPLMGGEVINGLALVASTKRWWALYPNFGSGQRYQAVEAPVRRGLIAPYAHATDGQVVFFWAKDGIWTTLGQSLTDADLHNIFPHEGVIGRDYVYGGNTVHAPDYKYASNFRLCFRNNYLYADYRDSEGLPRTLVCDLRDPANPAWCVDEYADPIGVHYGVEQQAGTLLSDSTIYSALVMGDDNGKVHVQRDLVNDNGTPIPAAVATFEFNGGDVRSNELYNDEFVDLIPAAVAGVNATILEGGTSVQAVFIIPTSTSRQHTNIPIGLELSYMGVLLEWIDDFDSQSIPTLLRSWQPMFQSAPVAVNLWKNQGTAFNLSGYKHLPRMLIAYKASAPVTLTITVYDGTAPAVVTLPSTAGAYRKTLFWLTFNKGMLYFVQARCDDAEFQLYLSDCEILVGAWERGDNYTVVRDIATAIGIGEG